MTQSSAPLIQTLKLRSGEVNNNIASNTGGVVHMRSYTAVVCLVILFMFVLKFLGQTYFQ